MGDVFKTYEQIEEYLNGDRIKCLECGHTYRMLGNHLLAKHAISAYDYREKYGIPHSYALYGQDSLKMMSEKMQARLNEDPDYKEKQIKNLITHHRIPRDWLKTRKVHPAELQRLDNVRPPMMTQERFLLILKEMKESNLSPREFLKKIDYSKQWLTLMIKRFGLHKELQEIYDNLAFAKLHIEKKKLVNADLITKIHAVVKLKGQRGAARELGISYHTVHRVINKKRGH
jgi:hypothetical protein